MSVLSNPATACLEQACGKADKVVFASPDTGQQGGVATCSWFRNAQALSGKAVRAFWLVSIMVITFVNRLQAVLLLLVFLVFPISESHAQSYELNTVVVTATRFDSEPDKSPVASQIITAEDIQFSSANTLSEVLNKLGGVHTRTSFTGIPDAAIDLRGFGASGDQNTLILLNGQRLSENEGIAARLSSIPLNAIDRIEILRGSGSVL
jgi:outer membrane receptor for ferrienterochelin and colicin